METNKRNGKKQSGAALELDNAFISKVENEERLLPRKHLENLAEFLNVPLDELLVLWLSDKMMELLQKQPLAEQALKMTQKRLKQGEKKN